ncbi:MAG: sugar lactone lactonase YvrE [Verrucomicrobiales bacterium]|jgi:sugar lactone lactonase YvrE
MRTILSLTLGTALLLNINTLGKENDLLKIISPTEKVAKLGTGMKFTEGPVWIPKEKRLVWSDIPNRRQMQWTTKDGISEWRKVEASNGNLLDLEGNLLSCQHAGRNVIRTEADGKITVLADSYKGMKLNSPNDLAIHSDGKIWFTDPTYGLKGKPSEIGKQNVYLLDPETGAVTVVRSDFDMPNGIAFSPDEKTIYISDTGKLGKIRAFEVPQSGSMQLQQSLFEIDIRCDGMCVDVEGNLYTTSSGGIHVFDKAGKKIGLIPVEEHPANVCFGGDDYKSLYITARKSLYSVKVKIAGAKPETAKW